MVAVHHTIKNMKVSTASIGKAAPLTVWETSITNQECKERRVISILSWMTMFALTEQQRWADNLTEFVTVLFIRALRESLCTEYWYQ